MLVRIKSSSAVVVTPAPIVAVASSAQSDAPPQITSSCPVIAAAEGAGPVNAIDGALRKALEVFYPEIGEIRLTDYKVRVLDSESAAAATVRVLIESTDGHEYWTTVGVAVDIMQASTRALMDSIEYKLLKSSATVKQSENRTESA